MIKYSILIFIIHLSCIDAVGQEPFYWQLTEEDGLPSMTIYQVHQDKKGFMWFGTENGICRYDGKEMETYYHPDLLDNEILTIQEDSWGRIWFKNLAGQLAYIEEEVKEIKLRDSLILTEFCIVEDYLVGLFRNDGGSLIKYVIKENGNLSLEYEEKKIGNPSIQKMLVQGDKIFGYLSRMGSSAVFEYKYIDNNELAFFQLERDGNNIGRINFIGKDRFLINQQSGIRRFQLQKDSLFFLKKEENYDFINHSFQWNEKVFFIGNEFILSLIHI